MGRNIYIMGSANCGKTVILDSLPVIYITFISPVTCMYARLGVEDNEVIVLNDFRYILGILPWTAFNFAAPNTMHARYIKFTNDTPVFATSKSLIVLIKGWSIHERETEMMDVKWRQFHSFHQIPVSSQTTVTSCSSCFAHLTLDMVE